MFLSGNRDGVIVSVQHISIHGTIMMDVAFQLKNETVPAAHAAAPRPSPAAQRWCSHRREFSDECGHQHTRVCLNNRCAKGQSNEKTLSHM
jgi:hypothetical protein